MSHEDGTPAENRLGRKLDDARERIAELEAEVKRLRKELRTTNKALAVRAEVLRIQACSKDDGRREAFEEAAAMARRSAKKAVAPHSLPYALAAALEAKAKEANS